MQDQQMTGSDERLSTREQMLYLLRRMGPMTAQELGRELGISVSGIRQHTAVLERAALITSRNRRQKVGRPGLEYVLSPQSEDAFPKVYKELALALLEAAHDVGGEELIRKLIDHWRGQVFLKYVDLLKDVPAGRRFARIAEYQDERGYLAHLENDSQTERLIHFNCPVQRLSASYEPKFCETERQMYEKLLGKKVKLVSCRAQGADCCCFSTEAS